MASVKRIVQQNFYTILLLLAVGGFVMILAELLLSDHVDGIQLVGVIASVVGLILGVAALFLTGRQARNVLAILFVVLSISGVIGVLQHADARGDEAGEAVLSGSTATPGYESVSLRAQEENEAEGRGGEGETVPPPLAPLSLSGLAFLGAVVMLGIQEPRTADVRAAKPSGRRPAKSTR